MIRNLAEIGTLKEMLRRAENLLCEAINEDRPVCKEIMFEEAHFLLNLVCDDMIMKIDTDKE